MPVFATGTPLAIRKAEAARTLGGQINSLTFIDRAVGRASLATAATAAGSDPGNSYMGMLLQSATNSLMFAGNSKRTIPRFQIGSRSGREYQQQIALSGGEGTLNLVFNPALELHRELMAPPLDSRYLIKSVMAPPYMNMVAGEYEHLRSGAVTLDPENQATMEVAFLDNFGAEYIPARLYQLTDRTATATGVRLDFSVLPEADADLVVALDTDGDDMEFTDDTLNITAQNSGANDGEIALSVVDGGPNLSTGVGTSYDVVGILHVPGEQGGYAVSNNLKAANFSAGVDLVDEDVFADRLVSSSAAMYFGLYATPNTGLLFRG